MLTRSEEKVLQFITRHIALHGRAPTRAEMCQGLGLNSRGTVEKHVSALEKKGHLYRDRSWGGLRLSGEATKRAHTLPLVGRISAGRPIEAISGQEDINIPELLLGPDRYVLKIKGDSMIGIGIHDGDYAVIRHTDTARTGDIVVALIDGNEATLKRYRKRKQGIELVAENPALAPLCYEDHRVQIQGVLVGSFRVY